MEIKKEEDIQEQFARFTEGQVMVKDHGRYYNYVRPYENIVKGNPFLNCFHKMTMMKMKRKMDDSGFLMSEDEILNREFPIIELTKNNCTIQNHCLIINSSNGRNYYYPKKGVEILKAQENMHVLVEQKKGDLLFVGTKRECLEIQSTLKDVGDSKAKNLKRKKKWIPEQLQKIQRIGDDYRSGKDVRGEQFVDEFGIRGGQFGNWTNDRDRQVSMNMAYDAFIDLAKALGISKKNIGLPGLANGSLGIAFGARGSGNAVAHYEPVEEVINLTKMRGAGSLAHEWMHALDDLVGKKSGSSEMASETKMSKIPWEFSALVKMLFFDENGKDTLYHKNSKIFEQEYAKEAHGYWVSPCEMLARAFSCYIKDKIERNDYLCGHAESYVLLIRGEIVCAFPQGEERKRINDQFDRTFKELKELKILHTASLEEFSKSKTETAVSKRDFATDPSTERLSFLENKNGQYSFLF